MDALHKLEKFGDECEIINQPMSDRKIDDVSNLLSLIGWIVCKIYCCKQ